MAERTESAVISVCLVGKDLKDEGEYREIKLEQESLDFSPPLRLFQHLKLKATLIGQL